MSDLGPPPSPGPLAPTVSALDVPLRRGLVRISELGFRAVQLSATTRGLRPRELDRSGRRDVLATLRRHGLVLAGLDAWIPPDHWKDQVLVDRAVSAVQAIVELAADWGGCPVSLAWPVDGTNAADIATIETARAAVVDYGHRRAIPIADHAVPLNDDPLGAVGVDPVRWLVAGEQPASAVHRAAGRVVSVRVCDLLDSGGRGPIGSGEGRLELDAYQVAVGLLDPPPSIVVDVRDWHDPWAGLQQTQNAWGMKA